MTVDSKNFKIVIPRESIEETRDRRSTGRILPGIHEVEITDISLEENKNDKPYIGMKISSSAGNAEHEERFFVSSDKAIEWTGKRLISLIETINGEVKNEGDISLDIDSLKKALVGKSVRLAFDGEEYEYDGNVYVRTVLRFMNFSENIEIPKEESALYFNEDRNIKRLETEEEEEKEDDISIEGNKDDDELAF